MSGKDETSAAQDIPTERASGAAIPDQATIPDQPSGPDQATGPDRASVLDQSSVPGQALGSEPAISADQPTPGAREPDETTPFDAVAEHDGAMVDDDARSLGQLVASASRDLSALVRGEIALAKAELKESAQAATKGAGLFGAAGFLAYVAFLMLSIAAGYGLVAAGFHPAVAFVIVGGVYLLVAGIIAYVGLRSVRKAKGPERTIHSIEEAKSMVGRANGGGGAADAPR